MWVRFGYGRASRQIGGSPSLGIRGGQLDRTPSGLTVAEQGSRHPPRRARWCMAAPGTFGGYCHRRSGGASSAREATARDPIPRTVIGAETSLHGQCRLRIATLMSPSSVEPGRYCSIDREPAPRTQMVPGHEAAVPRTRPRGHCRDLRRGRVGGPGSPLQGTPGSDGRFESVAIPAGLPRGSAAH